MVKCNFFFDTNPGVDIPPKFVGTLLLPRLPQVGEAVEIGDPLGLGKIHEIAYNPGNGSVDVYYGEDDSEEEE